MSLGTTSEAEEKDAQQAERYPLYQKIQVNFPPENIIFAGDVHDNPDSALCQSLEHICRAMHTRLQIATTVCELEIQWPHLTFVHQSPAAEKSPTADINAAIRRSLERASVSYPDTLLLRKPPLLPDEQIVDTLYTNANGTKETFVQNIKRRGLQTLGLWNDADARSRVESAHNRQWIEADNRKRFELLVQSVRAAVTGSGGSVLTVVEPPVLPLVKPRLHKSAETSPIHTDVEKIYSLPNIIFNFYIPSEHANSVSQFSHQLQRKLNENHPFYRVEENDGYLTVVYIHTQPLEQVRIHEINTVIADILQSMSVPSMNADWMQDWYATKESHLLGTEGFDAKKKWASAQLQKRHNQLGAAFDAVLLLKQGVLGIE